MLRAYFLACDFYPQILFAGDKPDLVPLLDALDELTDFGQPISLQQDSRIYLQDFSLSLALCEAEAEGGVFELDAMCFEWRMSKDTALDFYQDLEDLLCQPELSGSLFFEMLRLDEIKIKISMNEFDDSYLQN